MHENDWRPGASLTARHYRCHMLDAIRQFFKQRGILEVETAALSNAANSDPYIESFGIDARPDNQTNQAHPAPEHTPVSAKRFLHTSPEYPMKRLLAAGSGDIYQIARVWRRDEVGSLHNPEFSLLEWYRVGFAYQRLIQEVNDLLQTLFPEIDQPAEQFTYQRIFQDHLGIDPHDVSSDMDKKIQQALERFLPDLEQVDMSRQDALDGLLTRCIEPNFSRQLFTLITDYPVSQSALAAIQKCKANDNDKDKPDVALRFEVYFGTIELGNGYQEETGAERNREILQKDNRKRLENRQEPMPLDENFLAACQSGLPECSGVAMGIDRLLMLKMALLSGESKQSFNIKQSLNFPWEKA